MDNFILYPNGTAKRVDPDAKSIFQYLFPQDSYTFRENDRGVQEAYALSVLIHRCVTLKANTISTIPKRFVDASENEVSALHKVEKALGRRRTKLWRQMSQDWDVYGRIFLEPVRHPVSKQVYFKRINPYTIEVVRDSNGISAFRQVIDGATTHTWDPYELVYIWDYNPKDDLMGLSPILYVLKNVATELSIADFTKNYFENGGTPAGILSTDQLLRPKDSEQYRKEWTTSYGGSANTNKVAVLGGGLNYQQLTPSIKDMVVDTIGISNAKKVAQIFGVPMSMLFETGDDSRATSETARESFYRETIIPTFQFIADELTEQALPFITDEEIYLEADLFRIDVLQNDRKIITERATVGFKSGVRSLNEARKLEQVPTIEGGDVLFLGGRLIPMNKLGQEEYTNMILAGEPLNTNFTPNPTEPVNPDPEKQSYRNREQPTEKFTNIPKYSRMAIVAELRAWKKKIKNNGPNVGFVSEIIPETYIEFIQQDLKYAGEDADKQRDVLDGYIDFFDNNLSTEEQFNSIFAYNRHWKGISQFYTLIERVIEDYYFKELNSRTVDYLLHTDPPVMYETMVLTPLKTDTLKMLDSVITQLVLSGLNRGYELARDKDGKNLYDIINKVIVRAQNIANQIINDITTTNTKIVLGKLQEWVKASGTVETYTQYIQGVADTPTPVGFVTDKLLWLFSQERRMRVAEDISNQIFNDAILATHTALEKSSIWLTQRDGKVCSICAPLEGVGGSISEGFVSPADGLAYYPSRVHSGCRCFADAIDPIYTGDRL